jgi:4-hydroxythreonine-4-phosphate dehydrogenase
MSDEPHTSQPRPRIGITMGDPLGIGPEVIVKALADESLRSAAHYIIYGSERWMRQAAESAELRTEWTSRSPDVALYDVANVVIAEHGDLDVPPSGAREPTVATGRASMAYLDRAIDDARGGRIDALTTAPISKTAWRLAGFDLPGHTELLARKFRTRRVTMMFVGGPLRVALASVHVPLFELRNSFTIGLVFRPIDLIHHALVEWFGIAEPRIAVAGLNPHAGEGGLFGEEEQRVIEPAIEMARHAGIRATGPLPADTLFLRAANGEFDAVVAMYHDQALIPIKLLAFDRAVNLTLGLPIIRTSVDHGTAYDIAGKNRADPGSMKAALRLAIHLARRRQSTMSDAPPALRDQH